MCLPPTPLAYEALFVKTTHVTFKSSGVRVVFAGELHMGFINSCCMRCCAKWNDLRGQGKKEIMDEAGGEDDIIGFVRLFNRPC